MHFLLALLNFSSLENCGKQMSRFVLKNLAGFPIIVSFDGTLVFSHLAYFSMTRDTLYMLALRMPRHDTHTYTRNVHVTRKYVAEP